MRCAHCGLPVTWSDFVLNWVHDETIRSCAVALATEAGDSRELRAKGDTMWGARPIPYRPDGRPRTRRR